MVERFLQVRHVASRAGLKNSPGDRLTIVFSAKQAGQVHRMIYPDGVPATTVFNDWLAMVYSSDILIRPGVGADIPGFP
jgi:hypothetical protein